MNIRPCYSNTEILKKFRTLWSVNFWCGASNNKFSVVRNGKHLLLTHLWSPSRLRLLLHLGDVGSLADNDGPGWVNVAPHVSHPPPRVSELDQECLSQTENGTIRKQLKSCMASWSLGLELCTWSILLVKQVIWPTGIRGRDYASLTMGGLFQVARGRGCREWWLLGPLMQIRVSWVVLGRSLWRFSKGSIHL